ncbi:MAG: helix-turn-helix transcriptional regulator [Lachnospiraceae bacterium]|nr:helix-turn-helix transcriptional regulator [Lachnospiraceae bacterium]
MILADKIILLRKKMGWSQEQLAEQLDISRQSVSKWESGASIPDLDKIIKLSKLLGVSTDYLLKDEIEEFQIEGTPEKEEDTTREDVHSISAEDADTYMNLSREAAPKMAIATVLCILSPIALIVLGGISEYGKMGISEDTAGGIGLLILLAFVLPAVMIFIWQGMKLNKYEYMELQKVSLQYGVQGIVEKKKAAFEKNYRTCMVIGTALCILAVVPIFAGAALELSDLLLVYCVAALLFMVACGVFFFVWGCTIQESFDKLLEVGDYTREKKENRKYFRLFAAIYWCVVTAIYLCLLLPGGAKAGNWREDISWIVWPVAGVLFVAVLGIVKLVMQSKKKTNK